MDALDFGYHENHYRKLCGNANAWDYFREQALEVHILSVQDALREQLKASVFTSSHLADDEAKFYIRYGVGRRFGVLWRAYRGVLEIAPPGRVKPLSTEEVQLIDMDLNAIYLNIIGVIDNYAWCLRHERKSPRLEKLWHTKIGLFVPEFMNGPEFEELRPDIDLLNDWFVGLRSRRDPAAHRIPLTVPPARLSAEEQEKYGTLEQGINEALGHLDFARVEELRHRQEWLGQFNPVFFHHPDGPFFHLYPTIPQDIGNLIKVAKSVHKLLGIGQVEHA
jgi:hypothetical protein